MTALCAAAGKDIEKCVLLGALTCAIAGTIGYQYGKRLEERRKVLQGKEQDLCARLQYARALNSDTEEFNEGLQKEVAQLTQQTDKLVPKVREGKVSQQELSNSKKAINERIEVTKQNVARAENELQDLKQFRTTAAPSAELDAEITKLQGLLARAQGNTAALAAQGQRL
jgi:chromosome segregation ATPase